MGYQEYHIDERYGLFGRLYHSMIGTENLNPFLETHRTAITTFLAGSPFQPNYDEIDRAWSNFQRLMGRGVLATDSGTNEMFSPLRGHLVVPTDGTGPYPLAVFIHGQALAYFDLDGSNTDIRSYRGYRTLQQYLGDRRVASLSVDVNVPNHFGNSISWDMQQMCRLHVPFLLMAALHQVMTATISAGQPIMVVKSDTTLSPLHDVMALPLPLTANSPESRLRALRTDLAGKLDFTTLGFMGHSRGASTVLTMHNCWVPRVGAAPTDYATPHAPSTFVSSVPPNGSYNSNTRVVAATFSLQRHQYHAMLDTMAIFGSPQYAQLKTIVALQPVPAASNLSTDGTFLLVVASSHDEDTQETAYNGYENANCPKALIFSHGASHGRFNRTWRQIPYKREALNRQIACQVPIRMLSNAGHDNLSNATIGNAMLAGLRGQNYRYKFYTGEIRAASLGQDIERAWKFPFPLTGPPTFVLLDARAITAINTNTAAAVAMVPVPRLSARLVAGHQNYSNIVAVQSFTRLATQSCAIRIPVTAGDGMSSRTHFSFRHAKEYDSHDATVLSRVNLRNYSLQLKQGATRIGRVVAGADVPSQHQRAYPVTDWVDPNCVLDTTILLQTAELPLTQFLNSGQPASDLSQVDTIEITLNGTPGVAGDETWFFVDFLLTTRNLPAAPSGFVIP